MPSCGRILAENEYILSHGRNLSRKASGRIYIFNTYSIVNDGRESTEQLLHADRKLILKIKFSLECNRIGR